MQIITPITSCTCGGTSDTGFTSTCTTGTNIESPYNFAEIAIWTGGVTGVAEEIEVGNTGETVAAGTGTGGAVGIAGETLLAGGNCRKVEFVTAAGNTGI